MMEDALKLVVLSPEKQILDVSCSKVSLPGTKGNFTVLKNHRAIVSSLEEGKIVYASEGREHEVGIRSGFVEVAENKVIACVEI